MVYIHRGIEYKKEASAKMNKLYFIVVTTEGPRVNVMREGIKVKIFVLFDRYIYCWLFIYHFVDKEFSCDM